MAGFIAILVGQPALAAVRQAQSIRPSGRLSHEPVLLALASAELTTLHFPANKETFASVPAIRPARSDSGEK
jgi:hypothetical protein